jgi:flagellar biosynthesis/type III secretory pathway M-ring protein FliF/YscJ
MPIIVRQAEPTTGGVLRTVKKLILAAVLAAVVMVAIVWTAQTTMNSLISNLSHQAPAAHSTGSPTGH